MRITNTLTRLAAAFSVALVLNGAVVAGFSHVATHARVEASALRNHRA